MFNISFFLLSDESHGAVAEVGGANLQDDLGANPPSFAEVRTQLQLTGQFNQIPNMWVLTLTDKDDFVLQPGTEVQEGYWHSQTDCETQSNRYGQNQLTLKKRNFCDMMQSVY